MRLLSDNEIGFVVNSDKSDPEIKEAITEIVGNYEKRKYLATKGYQYAEKMFDESNNSKALMERLLTVFNQ
jgi:glycosyltransferase involved in cell wall biosynthesis